MVNEEISYDLVRACRDISEGKELEYGPGDGKESSRSFLGRGVGICESTNVDVEPIQQSDVAVVSDVEAGGKGGQGLFVVEEVVLLT